MKKPFKFYPDHADKDLYEIVAPYIYSLWIHSGRKDGKDQQDIGARSRKANPLFEELPLIRIGKGDYKLSFETLNGDIFLRHNENQ